MNQCGSKVQWFLYSVFALKQSAVRCLKLNRLNSHPDIILSDVAGLRYPPGLHRDLYWFGWQQVPRRFPAEEFLTRKTTRSTAEGAKPKLVCGILNTMDASITRQVVV